MNEKTQSLIIALLAVCVVIVGATVYAQNKQLALQGAKIDRFVELLALSQQKRDTSVLPTPSPTPKPATIIDNPGTDSGTSIVYGDFAAWLPLDWESRATATGSWVVTNDQNRNVATISCPSAEAGYEAWDITKSNRMYTHNGKTLYAGKWIGKPMRGSENLGWLATVWGGSPDMSAWGGTGCQIMFKVSSPPTTDELGRIDTIYQMIR